MRLKEQLSLLKMDRLILLPLTTVTLLVFIGMLSFDANSEEHQVSQSSNGKTIKLENAIAKFTGKYTWNSELRKYLFKKSIFHNDIFSFKNQKRSIKVGDSPSLS
ncbi:MAG: hypothetical protein KBD76_15710 [Bacteriovorax sp.]|nr:hypothetical protein [Bacteriovorax sp.]